VSPPPKRPTCPFQVTRRARHADTCRLRYIGILSAVVIGMVFAGNGPLHAQSLFGNRGPLSRGRTAQPLSFGKPPFAAGSSALTPPAFVGRGNPGGRFIGVRQSGQQTAGTAGGSASQSPGPAERPVAGSTEPAAVGDPARQGSSTRHAFRPRERIAFSFPPATPTLIDAALASQFEKLANQYPVFAAVQTETAAGGQVTLRGQVRAAADRRLVEILVRMQPGVRSVQNELMLTSPPSGPSPDLELP
jgi:hypothetical protein